MTPDILPHLLILAISLAAGIWAAVFLSAREADAKLKRTLKDREHLRRMLEERERNHAKRSDIRRLYQQATAEQIKRECGI